MSWAVSTTFCFGTITDKSLTIIVLIVTIIGHVSTVDNFNINSNLHKEPFSETPVNSTVWVGGPLVAAASQSTNIATPIPLNSSILLHGRRPPTTPQSTDSRFHISNSYSEKTNGISPETTSGQQSGILLETGTWATTAANAEIQLQSVQSGALDKASELSNQKSSRHELDFPTAFNEDIRTVAAIDDNNNNMKSFVFNHLAKSSVSTSSGHYLVSSVLLDKQPPSDKDVLAIGVNVVPDSTSNSLDAPLKTFIVTSIQAVVSAFQRRLIALSEFLRSFPAHSQVKPQPPSKADPVKQASTLPRKTKRSNFPGDLPEVSQSSKTAATKPSERINTPPNVHEVTTSSANPLQHPPSLYEDQSKKIPFRLELPARNGQDNSGSSFQTLDIQNSNPFINSSQENSLLSWFGGVSPILTTKDKTSKNVSSGVHENNTALVLASDGLMPCNDNCTRRQGVCVMGNDFRMHCVVDGNACEQFPCVNGECVATDGLYKCECLSGWVGTFCNTPCTLECGDNGYCDSFEQNDTVACICHWNYTGHRCQDKRTILHSIMEVPVGNGDLQVWEIAVVVIMIATCLGLLCVLLPYLLWRRQWIPIRKLIFYFQEYEDDDEKEFDAFISYKSTPKDEKFILQHLYPKLEKELHFKLCLHFRDFPPGEPIANNIIRAIEGSRRTILILSPSFISSEWCRMEYQKAQYEMLKLKHKIIPVILEDISGMTEIDRNLQNIMNTVTYITWPGDKDSASSKRIAKFWTLLELSMPKRKSEYQRCLTSSCSSIPLTNVDSVVSSISEEDAPTSSSSLDAESLSENSISSMDNTAISKQSLGPSESRPYCPGIFQDGVKNNCFSCPMHNFESCREEIVNVNSESEKVLNATNVNMSGFNKAVDKIVIHRRTSLSERENCGYLDKVTGGVNEPTKGDNECQGKEQPSVFLSSDDHIVEIRETGLNMNGVRIKSRPRQLFV